MPPQCVNASAVNGSLNEAPWSDLIFTDARCIRPQPAVFTCGVLRGEGIGPDVIDASLRVLAALEQVTTFKCEIQFGGPIGTEAEARCGQSLSGQVVEFCRAVFARGGAILAGPGGGRFVYDLRREFDLFCKLSPIKVHAELVHAARVKPGHLQGVDIMVVRENSGGIYQGHWTEAQTLTDGRKAEQSCCYTEKQVRRIVEVGARIAARRRGEMTVVIKEGGMPTLSRLWRDCAAAVSEKAGVAASFINVDLAAYWLIQHAPQLDVVVAPNLFGDVLADLGGVLLGARGLTYSGNFSARGEAVYQTNHGAAYDLVGKDEANPVGQIFSLAMLLRESFGLAAEAALIEQAVTRVWRQGWRTVDLKEAGTHLAGTKEMGERVAAAIVQLAGVSSSGGVAGGATGRRNARIAGFSAETLPSDRLSSCSSATLGAIQVTADKTVFLPASLVDDCERPQAGQDCLVHFSPRQTDHELWRVSISNAEQIARATAAGKRAGNEWRTTSLEARAEILERLAALLAEAGPALACQLAVEVGKPITQASAEVSRTVDLIKIVLQQAHGLRAENCTPDSWRRFQPVGVIAMVTPWNNPLAIPVGKIAPALMYGNSVVWKPAPAGSGIAVRVLELLRQSGCPAAVVNLVCGGAATARRLMADANVAAVTLTGSEAAGAAAQEICARRRVPLQAELGGNNAAIVWTDCKVDLAAAQIAAAAFGFAGQRCTANRRAIVHARCYDDFLSCLEAAVLRLVWEDPLNPKTQVGPLISSPACQRVAAVVERACQAAKVILAPHHAQGQGDDLMRAGAYFPPTIVGCDDPACEIVQEETFGPVLVVQRAGEWEEAMRLCNGVRQGLVAALFSESEEIQARFLEEAQAGVLKINLATADANAAAPFGGWKASGFGPPEHGESDREFYTRTQTVYHRDSKP